MIGSKDMSNAVTQLSAIDKRLKGLNFGAFGDNLGLYYAVDLFENEKDKRSYIKNVERLVRSSQEYRKFIDYLRQDMEFNNCAILTKLSSDRVSVEFHHAVWTLYEIVETVINRRLTKNLPLTTFSISEEVMILHYTNSVGLIPLSKTMHELAHSNGLAIDPRLIIGDYKSFLTIYEPFMETSALEKYENWQEAYKDEPSIPTNSYLSTEKLGNFISKTTSFNNSVEILHTIEH